MAASGQTTAQLRQPAHLDSSATSRGVYAAAADLGVHRQGALRAKRHAKAAAFAVDKVNDGSLA